MNKIIEKVKESIGFNYDGKDCEKCKHYKDYICNYFSEINYLLRVSKNSVCNNYEFNKEFYNKS